MTRKAILLSIASLMVLSLTFRVTALKASADAGEPIIIANPRVAAQSLSSDEVKNIFLGKKTKWEDGNPITFILLKDKTIHKRFLEKYVDSTPSQYSRYWRGLLFSGRGRCPKTLPAAEALHFIAETEGAIGYVISGNEKDKRIVVK